MNRITWRLVAILLALVGLFVMGCGNGDDDDNDDNDNDNDNDQADDDAADDDAADDDSAECPDADGDGFTDATCGGEDCNDADDTIYPGAEDVCGDSIDQDCDDVADDGCLSWEVEAVTDPGFTCTDSANAWIKCYSIAFTPDGDPVVAVYDETNFDLQVGIRSAKGEWFLETVDSDGEVGRDPSIDVDSTGRIGVAYYTNDTTEIRVAMKSPGGNWKISSLGSVGGFMDIGGKPYLRFNSNDMAQVAGYKFLTGEVDYWQETAAGGWEKKRPFQQSAYGYGPVFDLDSQDHPGLVWQNEEDDYATRAFYFGYWNLETEGGQVSTIYSGPDPSGTPYHSFAFDGADTPHAFYALGLPMQISMATYVDSTWQKSKVPDDSSQLTGPVEARRDPDGNLWISYGSDYPLTPRLGHLVGDTWSFIDVLDNTASQYGKKPSFNLDADGLPGVVYYYQPDIMNGQLMYARMTGIPEVD
ncbi:MAG: hypothetical protein GX444_20795 [Myxococcales bacterium]|nr:hypothetical protein [Myxococcales bacterium]